MGTVYAACDPHLDRRVALKLVPDTDRSTREQLLAEAPALARLSHPHVVPIHRPDLSLVALAASSGGVVRPRQDSMSIRIDLRELAARESEQVEWKENVADVEDVVATITAFANDLANLGGGYVVCGAREVRDEHGFQAVEMLGLTSARAKEVEGKVLALCRHKVDPSVAPMIEEIETADPVRRILVFIVPASRRAHLFRNRDDSGKYYVRVGRETIEARNGLFRELLLCKGEVEPWDRRPCSTSTLEDIDLVAFRDALYRMGVYDPARSIDDYFSEKTQLSPFVPSLCVREPLTGVLRPRNFTVLLFGRSTQRYVAGAYVLFSIYPGEDRSEPHAERHEIAGSVLEQIRRLVELLNVQAYTTFDKTDEAMPNAVKYPRRALHEAMVNAIAHRDYERVDPARITVFSDRIEILSPGSLMPSIDPVQLRAGKASPKWRNQALAWFLNRLQLAQAEGQGIPTILRTMQEEGCPPPEFEIGPDQLLCRLPAHPRHALTREHRAIEQAISLGELDRARERVKLLIDRDPFDFRTVQLFAEIQRALAEPGLILDFVKRHEDHLDSFSPLALVHLGDALLSMPRPSNQERAVARQLVSTATRGRFEQREARRVALSLLKVHDDAEALEFLERCLREHPDWRSSSAFLQLRGRALLALARRCTSTGRDRSLPPETKARAWRDCRAYLDRAERDLKEALTHGPEPAVEDHIRVDLEKLQQLRRQAQPPRRRGRGRGG